MRYHEELESKSDDEIMIQVVSGAFAENLVDEFGENILIAAIGSKRLGLVKRIIGTGKFSIWYKTDTCSPVGRAMSLSADEAADYLKVLFEHDNWKASIDSHWEFCPEILEPLIHCV